MGQHFDELAKALASGVSRRTALRRFVVGSLGAAAATLLPGQTSLAWGDDEEDRDRLCKQFCQRCGLSGAEYLLCVKACEHNIQFNGINFNLVNFNQISLNCI